MKGCFESAIRSHLQSQYRLLIVDGYTSYISTEFIKFTQTHKIIRLCLPPHLTHLLQPLDVSVFGPLKQNHKKLSSDNVDKTDFILLIQKARQQCITSQNIQSAWRRAAELILYNPTVVFQKLSINANNTSASDIENTGASSNTLLQTWFFSEVIPPIPGNVKQVTEIEELISLFQLQTLNSPKLTILHKTLKAARLAITDRVVLSRTNTEFLAANTQKKQRA